MLAAAPAHAGTWKFSCTGSGTSDSSYSDLYSPMYGGPFTAHANWVPPSASPGTSYTIPSFGGGGFGGSANADAAATGDVSIKATITITWVPDTSLPSDPAPPSLWLIESSGCTYSASYSPYGVIHTGSGDANDGLSSPADPLVDTFERGVKNGAYMRSANAPAGTVPPAHWFKKDVAGGVITLNRTFTAHATASFPHDGSTGTMNVNCSFEGYSVSIHAQPYNWHITGVTPGPAPTHGIKAGELEFLYGWSSTSGSISDLNMCFLHELVTYPGPNPFTVPAPFSWANPLPNGVPYPGSGAKGLAMTDLANGRDVQHYFTPVQPYFAGTLSATQVFQFDDTATGETNVTVPGTDATGTILRSFSRLSGTSPWYYTVSKGNSNTTVAVAP